MIYALIVIGIINGGYNIHSIDFSSLQRCNEAKANIETVTSGQPPVYIECVLK